MSNKEHLSRIPKFTEITPQSEESVNKILKATGVLSSFTCFPQFYSFLKKPNTHLFVVTVENGDDRLVLNHTESKINDVRILFEKKDDDKNLIELVKKQFTPNYLAYNLIPERPNSNVENDAVREELIINVDNIANMQDGDVRRDFNKCQRNHPQLEYREASIKDKNIIDSFLVEWSRQTSNNTENARQFINSYLDSDQVKGSLVLDGEKVIGIVFHTNHPSDSTIAVNVILQNLRGYERLGEWLTVKHAQQLKEEGFKQALIGGTESKSKEHFKNKFMKNGQKNKYISQEIYRDDSLSIPRNFLRDIWSIPFNYYEFLEKTMSTFDHVYTLDISKSKMREFGSLEKSKYFPNLNQFVSVALQSEDSQQKKALRNTVFFSEFDKLTPENKLLLLKSCFSNGVIENTLFGFSNTNPVDFIAGKAVSEITEDRLDAINQTQHIFESLVNLDDPSFNLQVKNTLIKTLVSISKNDGVFYERYVKGKLENSIFEKYIASTIVLLLSNPNNELSSVLKFIPTLTYYLRHPQELIFLSGFSQNWMKLGLENLCLVGTHLSDIYKNPFEEKNINNVVGELKLENIEIEFPGISDSIGKYKDINKNITVSENNEYVIFKITAIDRQKMVIAPRNNQNLIAAALEQCYFFYENSQFDKDYANKTQVQILADDIKSNSGGQALGQSLADYGFITMKGALKYANTASGRMEHERHERFHLMAFNRWPHLRIMSVLPEVLEGIPYAYFNRIDPKMLFLSDENMKLFEGIKHNGFWNPSLEGAKYSFAFLIWKHFDEEMQKLGIPNGLTTLLDEMEDLQGNGIGILSENLIFNDTEESINKIYPRFTDLYSLSLKNIFTRYQVAKDNPYSKYEFLVDSTLNGSQNYFNRSETSSRITELFGTSIGKRSTVS